MYEQRLSNVGNGNCIDVYIPFLATEMPLPFFSTVLLLLTSNLWLDFNNCTASSKICYHFAAEQRDRVSLAGCAHAVRSQ